MKIYLVSEGQYSDYHIIGLYSSRAKAQEAYWLWGDCNDIEERDVNPPLPDHPKGERLWSVGMSKNGDTISVHPKSPMSRVREPYACFRSDTDAIFEVWAKDAKSAVKITNEKRLALLAEDKWPVYTKDIPAHWWGLKDASV